MPQVLNYDVYRLSAGELLLAALKGAAADALFAYAFYRSMRVFIFCLLPIVAAAAALERKRRREERLLKLSGQFKESMLVLAGHMRAGYSVENAFFAGMQELISMYGQDGLIVKEFKTITWKLQSNITAEAAMADLAERSGIEEIRNFAEVFAVAKRSSGDIGSIMRHSAQVIRDTMQIKEEVAVMTASKRFEQRIMNIIPFGIILYVDGASPGFFDQMYGTTAGRLIMTGCVCLYGLSVYISDRFLKVEV